MGVSLPLALAVYLKGFGMEPLLLHMEEFYPEDKAHAKQLLALGQNPHICRMVHGESDLPVLERLAPDLCFGGLPPENQTIPKLDRMHTVYGRVGYELAIELLTQIFAVLNKEGVSMKGGVRRGTAPL